MEGCVDAALPWFEFTVYFTILIYVAETYLDIRQYWKLCETNPPALLLSTVERVSSSYKKTIRQKFAKAQAYGRAKASFGMFSRLFDETLGVALLVLGFGPYAWDLTVPVVSYFGYPSSHTIARSVALMAIQHYLMLPFSIPFDLYRQFVIEEKFGFNKSTFGLYCSDFLKSEAITIAIGTPLLVTLLKIIEWGGPYFYVYVWGFLFVFAMVMLTIYPTFIQPCFNKVEPLEQGPLREAIESLASKVQFPLTKLFVIDGSKRSHHSNAYMYGLWKNKRIVLFDTLLKQASQNEIVAVLAHELGHWSMYHTVQGLAISQVITFCLFFSYGQVKDNADMFAAFGYYFDASTGFPAIIGINLFISTLWSPINKVLERFMTFNTRKNEFQADAYATHLGYAKDLQTGLIKLQIENLSNMNPDPLYSAYHYSHPPLVERIEAIQDEETRRTEEKKKAL